ncbi:DUF885 domain-containing protein [Blastococcus sp. Marseille-P5729]|uniref:DUF885 domain-containing protein n=1 Tax=Blastococcus sp. Marseille-P5729 TaxID=2086582 RepID=UPI000D0F3F0E|nr:DUF885 domain-containing protein [Blastococcus sp. Marseille-P5729]
MPQPVETPDPQARTPTEVDAIADGYLDDLLQLSPIEATRQGLPTRQDEYDDYSPAGIAAKTDLARTALASLERAEPSDDVDVVTVAAMRERLGLEIERADARLTAGALNSIHSPFQWLRDTIDLMPTAHDDDWAMIGRRLQSLPSAFDHYFEGLRYAADGGVRAARRQVQACIDQAHSLTAPDGYFATLVANSSATGTAHDELRRGVEAAATAYRTAARRLTEEWLPAAPERDAVGIERYQLESRVFLGESIDLADAYAWGQEELARITSLMQQTAEQIQPGATVGEAIDALDADPRYQLHGTDALMAWMQHKADEAIDVLNGAHFDIPEPVRRIECLISPSSSGGVYYTAPSEDFSRPGRMWWSVGKNTTRFVTWRRLTTVYHEGVPGHHLQLGQTVYRATLLNRWRRMGCWVSGHGEGWALYSEWLMSELGYLNDPAYRMGMLNSQSLRATRVVLDIGIHCGFEAPAEVGGGRWSFGKASEYFAAKVHMAEGFRRRELVRYLGWPGQAPSYKIGERAWLQLREENHRRDGAAFDLKAFHRRALDIGSVGLDTLRRALLP